MPKFMSYKGMGPGKIIQEFNDKLHINGRVYRTSDLSEIVGKAAMVPHHAATVNSPSWSLRLKRGFQPGTRLDNYPRYAANLLSDFDVALCGNWAGVTTAGVFLDNTKYRQLLNTSGAGYVIDVDTETGAVTAAESSGVFGSYNNEYGVFLPPGPGGAVAMFRKADSTGGAAAVERYDAGSTASTLAATLFGTRTTAATAQPFYYRINDNPQRWYFIGAQVGTSVSTTLEIRNISKATLAATYMSSALAAPAGAALVGTGGLGYNNSVPSYAYTSGVNELSSYLVWRTATGMELHRVQISGTDGIPTVSNNLVTLDQNPMGIHGSTSYSSCVRTQLITHSDGNKYLMIFGMEVENITPNAAVSMIHVYKLATKDTAQFVGSYALAQSPRGYLASDDSGLRFVMVYDDRYEFWAVGAGGVLSKVDTVYVQRNNATQYHHAWPYGFDSTGRFWYVTTESQKPGQYTELGLNFYSPPGQVNTISVSFDSDNYTYSGAPVNGNLTVSVKDITGAFIATVVNLSPTVNMSLSSTQVQTQTNGPTLVPFTVNAPGDLSVDAWT